MLLAGDRPADWIPSRSPRASLRIFWKCWLRERLVTECGEGNGMLDLEAAGKE